jgi:hypothetical protein
MIYRIESTLNDYAMEKMKENISILINHINEYLIYTNEIDQVIDMFRSLPLQNSNWIDHPMNEYEISVSLSNKCRIIFNIKDINRDFKINNILKNPGI